MEAMGSWFLSAFREPITMEACWSAAMAVLPIWVFGAIVGFLLPRPKWLSKGSRSATLLMTSPAGTYLRKLALVVHALVIVREVWSYFTRPGTFRALLRATVQACTGRGWSFQWPALPVGAAASMAGSAAAEGTRRCDNWYVGEKDLAFFKYHAIEGGPCAGASDWEVMFDKDIPNFLRYTAWRRTLPGGKTEYKSVTICPDVTAQEFMDMYLDDAFRPNWDGMVVHHEVLEHGDFSQRQQVVRWIRRFPFSFLSDREYTIARRQYREPDGALYAITKAVAGHPREARDSRVVKMDVFWSMWCSRTVADPWGAVAPACKTVLLHHEQFKIPENLARFAVRHGMWGFVRKLSSTVPMYVEARRKRVDPHGVDPAAYGAGNSPNPPLRRGGDSSTSLNSSAASSASDAGASDDGASEASGGDGPGFNARAGGRMRGVAAVLVAGGLALALGARGGSVSAGGGASRRRVGGTPDKLARRQGSRRAPRGQLFVSIAEEH